MPERLKSWRMPDWRPSLIDRYILRHLLGWYAAVVAIIIALLWLETLPRLVDQLGKVRSGARLVITTLINLAPEYLSIGIPLAVFLGTAFTFRRLMLAGEIDVLAAAGISDRRLLRWPIIVALASCLFLVGLRAWWEPAGERQIDAISHGVLNGDYGLGLEAGTPHAVGPHSSIYFDRVGPGRALEGVFVEQGPTLATARSARLAAEPNGEALIEMTDGVVQTDVSGLGTQSVRFHRFGLSVPLLIHDPPTRQSPRTRLDRYALTDLFSLPDEAVATGLRPAMAIAAASGRIATILLCALMPLLAFALAMPPKRSRSAVGLGFGIAAIIIFWKSAALVEDTFAGGAPWAHGALLVAFAAAIFGLLRVEQRHGHGTVEAALARTVGRVPRFLQAHFPGRFR